jgi:hypothetical protein
MIERWKLRALCAVIALMIAAPLPAHAVGTKSAATSKTSATRSASKSKNSLRQFTGVVTALDKTSITVEKGGKKPKTMVFAKDAEMRTQGDIEKDARVTVYYKDDGGHAVAHRVVVKSES